MFTRLKIDELFNELGKNLQLPNIKLDNYGYLSLTFDEKIIVNFDFFEEAGTLFIYSPIGKVLTNKEKMYETFLIANFFWSETGGGTISLEKKTQSIVLVKKIEDENISYQQFEKEVEIFVNNTERWIEIISGKKSIENTKKNENLLQDEQGIKV